MVRLEKSIFCSWGSTFQECRAPGPRKAKLGPSADPMSFVYKLGWLGGEGGLLNRFLSKGNALCTFHLVTDIQSVYVMFSARLGE